MFFFSISALIIWVIYVAMHTGVPTQPAANVARLAPEFVPQFSLPALGIALAGTVAWLALVRWRTGRHQHALWKSLVLPAGGVALSWLLLMTLWLPLLDHARSYRPLVQRLAPAPARSDGCVATANLTRSQLAALEVHGTWRLSLDPRTTDCRWLLVGHRERVNTPCRPSADADHARLDTRWHASAARPTGTRSCWSIVGRDQVSNRRWPQHPHTVTPGT